MLRKLGKEFIDNAIDRRTFIRRLTQAGVTLTGATAMADSLGSEPIAETRAQNTQADPAIIPTSSAVDKGRIVKNMTGGDVMLEFLKDWKVPYLFGLAGSEETGLLDALVDRPEIPFVTCLHESAAVAMADGYSRSTGQTSILSLHSVAGAAYGLGQIVGSFRDRTPIVVCVGRQAVDYRGQDGFLEAANLHTLPENYAQWTWDVMHESTIPEVLRRAFMFAEVPPGGPTFVTFSNDLWEKNIAKAEILPRSRSIANNNIPPSKQHVKAIVDNLLAAKKPLIYIGNEASRFEVSDPVAEIASRIGALIMLADKVPVSVDNRHPNFGGQFHSDDPSISAEIDCFWSLGAQLFKKAKKPKAPLLNREAVIMHTSLASEDIGRNYPIDTSAIANISITVEFVLKELKTRNIGTEVNRQRKQWAESYARTYRGKYDDEVKRNWNNQPIAPSRLVVELDRRVDDNAYVVSEIVTSDSHLRKVFKFGDGGANQRRNFDTTSGVLGWGLAAAIGVKIGNPKKEVWCLTGDGCFNFGSQALWSAARYEVPIAVVIFNNGQYQANRLNQNRSGAPRMKATGKYIGVNLGHPDINYVTMAASYGIEGERVTEPDSIAGALKHAQNSIRKGKPYLVDVKIEPLFEGKDSDYYDFFSIADQQNHS